MNKTNEDGEIEEIMLDQPAKDQLESGGRHKSGQKIQDGNEGSEIDEKYFKMAENSEQFKALPPEMISKIRLAKAGLEKRKDLDEEIDLEKIQLSPKKNQKGKVENQ